MREGLAVRSPGRRPQTRRCPPPGSWLAAPRCPTCPHGADVFGRADSSHGRPAHVSSLSGPATSGRYAASYTSPTASGGFGHLSSLSCVLSAAAVRFLASCPATELKPSLQSVYRRLVRSAGP